MRMLAALSYWLAWWLYRPLLTLVKFKATPENLFERLGLDPVSYTHLTLPTTPYV